MDRRQFLGALALAGVAGIARAFEPARILIAQAAPARRLPT